jgi:integrase
MKKKLTDQLLRALAVTGQPHEPIWDTTVSGFGIRIRAHGRITFFAMRRMKGGPRPVRVTIGCYSFLSLGDARERARAILRDLATGIDPRVREAERLRTEAAKQQNTFSTVAEAFIAKHASRKRSARIIELLVRRELVRVWGAKQISDVSRADVITLLDTIMDRGHPAAAHSVFGYGKLLFNWAIQRGVIEASPFDRIKRGALLGEKGSRTRLLTAQELRLIWAATADMDYPAAPFLRLLLLLGVRRGELAGARWSEFDLDAATWIIPGGPLGRMKNGEDFLVALPVPAVNILKALPRFVGCDYVFTARGDQPINDFCGLKARLDARIAELNAGTPIPHFVMHDTRRCVRTNMSALRVEPHIAERCLAHRQGGISKVYDLWQFADEKREALAQWATRLLAIVGDNVVPLRSVG